MVRKKTNVLEIHFRTWSLDTRCTLHNNFRISHNFSLEDQDEILKKERKITVTILNVCSLILNYE